MSGTEKYLQIKYYINRQKICINRYEILKNKLIKYKCNIFILFVYIYIMFQNKPMLIAFMMLEISI